VAKQPWQVLWPSLLRQRDVWSVKWCVKLGVESKHHLMCHGANKSSDVKSTERQLLTRYEPATHVAIERVQAK
jgi:hypothetical protein